jgi:hypothetical protein
MSGSKQFDNIEELIQCVDIGLELNNDLVRWTRPQTNIFRLEVMRAREMAKEGCYLHIETSNRRIVFIKHSTIIFTIIAEEIVQYQLLEAILEEILNSFLDTYKDLLNGFMNGMTSIFRGFQPQISPLFKQALNKNIKWISASCSVCGCKHTICIKKSLIINAPQYPVSIVYKHEGLGLLIYIDGDFKVRGQEIVSITG